MNPIALHKKLERSAQAFDAARNVVEASGKQHDALVAQVNKLQESVDTLVATNADLAELVRKSLVARRDAERNTR